MTKLTFQVPDRTAVEVEVNQVLNAGYAGRDQERVQAHIDELSELGIPAPTTTPTLYAVSPYLARQASTVDVQHDRTSGEVEWALVITGDDVLLTVACDHTDRQLEVHGVAWSKNASPDILGTNAWRLADLADHLDAVRLRAWVGSGEQRRLIQEGTLADLLPPNYWLDVLRTRGMYRPGTVLLSGTVAMIEGVDQFAEHWEVELSDEVSGRVISHAYDVRTMATPID